MTDPITAISTITLVAGKIVDALISKGIETSVDTGIQKFSRNSSQQVFRQALVDAIHRYTTYGSRFALGENLLGEDSPLVQDDVAKEISQILKFDREPNYQYIGEKWRSVVQSPPAWRDFTFEAQLLIGFFKEELQATKQFRPVFDSKNLNAINKNLDLETQTLIDAEQDIKDLISLMNSQFGNMAKIFSNSTPGIRENIRDFSWYIEEKTQGFVGRKFIFDAIKEYLVEKNRGYFLIKGDPGIGKTALAAEYVKQTGCIHHFNSRSHGINRPDIFLNNICAQIITAFNLHYSFLPPDSIKDSEFLIRLLNEASEKLSANQKLIILVDALDEVEDSDMSQGANLLCLPPILPKGVYVIATLRRTDIRLRIECEQKTLLVYQDMYENTVDIQKYISGKLKEKGIQDYLSFQSISTESFIKQLAEKSQGNFMYLRYVLPEIEIGAYKDTKLDTLPEGLVNYYEDHWRRMRTKSENSWFEYKLPIITALSIVPEPVSIDLLSEFAQIRDLRRIHSVLTEWQQFLYLQKVETEKGSQKRWRVYHDSFREFIAQKDEVANEHVNIKDAHNKIANALGEGFFNERPE